MRLWSSATLSGVRITERWYDVRFNVHFTRAELDLGQIVPAAREAGTAQPDLERREAAVRSAVDRISAESRAR